MWFRNKNTGAEWDITDPNTLARVKADPTTYEEVKPEEPAKPEKKIREPDKSG